MGETVAVNGEARTGVKVIEARLADCQRSCVDADERNRQDHQAVFDRLRTLEQGQERIVTRLTMILSAVAFLATIAGQIVVKLVVK